MHKFLVIVFLFVTSLGYTQDENAILFKDTLDAKSPIPISYITPKSIKVLADLEDQQRKIKQYDNLDDLNTDWDALSDDIEGYLSRFRYVMYSEHKTRILYNHQQELLFWRDEVIDFQEQIISNGDELEAQYNDLYKLGQKWLITLENAEDLKVEIVVVQQIFSVLNKIQETQKQIRKTQTHFITIDGEITKKRLRLEDKIESLKKYRANSVLNWRLRPRYFSKLYYSFSEYYDMKARDVENDWSYFIWVFKSVKVKHLLYLLIFFSICYFIIFLAQRNIKHYPFWSQEMDSEGGLGFLFENKIVFSALLTVLYSFRVIPNLSYVHLSIMNVLIMVLCYIVYKGLRFHRFKDSWWIVFTLLGLNFLILPFHIDHVLDVFFVCVFNALVVVLTLRYMKRRSPNSSKIEIVRYLILLLPLASSIGFITKNEELIFVPIDIAMSIIVFSIIFSVIQRAILLVLPVGLIGSYLFFLESIKTNKDKMVYQIQHILKLVSWYLWVAIPLALVEQTDNVYNFVSGIFSYPIEVGSISFSFSSVLIFSLGIYLTLFIGNIVTTILKEDIVRVAKIKQDGASAILLLTRYFFFSFGIFISLAAAGIDLSNVAVVLGALSVGIGFGLQGLVSNFISGLILIAERPFKLGDILELGNNTFGEIKEIGIRSSKIHMTNGSEVIVPNDELVSNRLTNWTLSDKNRRIKMLIGVSYDSDPREVKTVIEEVIRRNDFILKKPEPIVALDEFADSSINFNVMVWVGENWVRDKGDLLADIFMTFRERGIEIPFPQRDIHIIEQDFEDVKDELNVNTPGSPE